MRLRIGIILLSIAAFASPAVATTPGRSKSKNIKTAPEYRQYAGRYTDGIDYVVYFEESQFGLTLRPALWTATQLLKGDGNGRFVVVDRPQRGAVFHSDDKGRVVAVTIQGMEGEGKRLPRAGQTLLPVEILLAGNGRGAAQAYLHQGATNVTRFTEIAERVFSRFPTKSSAVVSFLSAIAPRFPNDAKLHTLLGYAQVASGSRRLALTSFRRAYLLDPNNKEIISALARLKALPKTFSGGPGWTIPFPLELVFKKPTVAEIKKVEADWRTRDLRPGGVEEVATGRIDLGQSSAVVRILSHVVLGSRHYGVIIVPEGATRGCCPVIIEAKGVSWNYFPLELEKLHSPRLLGSLQSKFIYVIPSFRGEILRFGGKTYQSEGERTNALDGATDDALALLNVTLQTTPEADADRVCAFGHSRGGTVALLTAIREPRVKCVVNWAGPTDWFDLMGTEGWTEQELYAEGLRTKASPSETGGQNVERFLLKAIKGEDKLEAVRHRMIASSPVYFARRLPRTQLHYGVEDPSVPVRNGTQLVAELRRHKVPRSRYEAFFYQGQGHDTDRIAAPVATQRFLAKILLAEK